MRLNKVQQLDFASFRNFKCDDVVNQFGDINIILGWNGSGKTTLSRVLRSLELGACEGGMRFQLETDKGTLTESGASLDLANKVRVFNKDYVDSVLNANKEIPYVVYIGEESVDYSKKEEKLKSKQKEAKESTCDAEHDQVATNAAKQVREITGIYKVVRPLTKGSLYGDYDIRDFKKRVGFFEREIQEKKPQISAAQYVQNEYLLSKDKLKSVQQQIVSSEQLDRVKGVIESTTQWIKDNEGSINTLLQKTPQHESSQRIKALTKTERDWVRSGVDIHFSNPDHSKTKCLFCDSDIENQEELLLHFSQEVLNLTNAMREVERSIKQHQQELGRVSGADIQQEEDIEVLEEHLNLFLTKLEEKNQSVTSALEPIEPFSAKERSVQEEDSKAQETDERQSWAERAECHYVAEVIEQYWEKKQEYEGCKKQREELLSEIRELRGEVSDLKSKAKNTHKAAERLNSAFQITFPHGGITIRSNSEETGYELARDGKDCTLDTLSEGEHNFLALLYFLISLDDEENELDANALIIIDDPVSSLDKSSIFQIFSQIVNEIRKKSERQYIVMTHSLDFLGHLLEHYRKKINENTGKVCLYNVSLSAEGSKIENMHELLRKHKSDYYYIFYNLGQKLEACSPEDAYLVANLLRRWLETFLNFKFSSGDDFRSLLSKAYKKAGEQSSSDWVPAYQPDEMYRFLNHGSHSFSDTETMDQSLLSNAHLRIKEAFSLVEALDPLHYEKLKKILD